jgi:ABC-type transport system substrate-binding protein
MTRGFRSIARMALALAAALIATACDNNPHPAGLAGKNVLFSAFNERSPKHLDPIASYYNNETQVTYQVYEPLYGYHYLKRPFALVPKSAAEVVNPRYLDKNGQPLPADAPGELVAESVYDIPIRRGVRYAPHPAFAIDAQGKYRYHSDGKLSAAEVGDKRSPFDFPYQGTREMVAEDFVYTLKRHATPRIIAPIYPTFADYVVGLKDYGELIKAEDAKLRKGLDPASQDKPFLDFRRWPLAGASAPEKHLLRIRIIGKYPQWKYWMTLTFLAPVPWEADAFYAQPGMAANGLVFDIWPVGTGPYMLAEYVKDRSHVLKRNPNFRQDLYPCEGMPGDKEEGLLADCGKPMPFIDEVRFNIEKEAVPLKAKFRQGFLEVPQIERTDEGVPYLVEMDDSERVKREYTDKGLRFPKFVDISSWYVGFNMLDPVIGKGATLEQDAKNRKLRQALAIAIDWEERSRIFPKDAGETAMSPLPAGLFGSRHGTAEGVNPVTHRWAEGKAVRRDIADAKKLLAEAGYPDGREAKTGKPLVLNYDYFGAPTPERKAEFDWMVKQYAKLGVQLEIRATDNNQFQDKVRKGKHQIFWAGWLADYPDAENFLFLLYGPNATSKSDGVNYANYENAEYDKLYAKLKLLDDGPEKQALIDRMVRIAQEDAPWTFGYFPYASGAFQQWVGNTKPAILTRDMVKYYRVDAALREAKLAEWNRPLWWPLLLLIAVLGWFVWRTRASFQAREMATGRAPVVVPAAKG